MVILLTLVIQGLTLPWIIRRARVFDGFMEEPEELARQKLRQGLMEHTHRFLKDKHDNDLKNQAHLQKLLNHWEEKAKSSSDDWMNSKTKSIFLEMLESQRSYLDNLNRHDGIDEEVIRWQLYLIDLEEERMKTL
jgi:CPA1 family monovalent cation:H+ antiporter